MPTADRIAASLAEARPRTFWLDPEVPGHDVPEPAPALTGHVETDLAVVGGGFSGLWSALIAKERDPGRDVVLLEARTAGWAASGRNGGFCAAGLTHGYANGAERWPEEIAELERLGRRNLDEIETAVKRHGIDCEFERTGEMLVATEPWQAAELAEYAEQMRALGYPVDALDAAQTRAEVDSPTYVGGVVDRDGVAMVHPAKLAWGLREACLRLGVRIFENTPVRRIRSAPGGLRLESRGGSVRARRVAWGTGAFPGPLRRIRHFVAPVYDYALVTEPLDQEQMAAIGWKGRHGTSDSANQFHYYRLTADNRILWGGYDVIYHYGGKVRPEYDQRAETSEKLAEHFFATFPQLEGVRFTHRWGGVIDTCSRFCAFFGTAFGGRLAYAAGFTGLGVGATRFGAEVMLDRLAGEETERTRLEMVRTKPIPFPPEPVRFAGIEITRRSIAAADANEGRRNLWLRTLDTLGLGFDS
ncbi:glycine/D-amino acid oxidase-like deaminating enzyme [Spinactinospora alkalitolerans]|uniref:Glycine/D-amino acid oxidase-like deaminating enzyme n=1 Tax=Spinactinospora alkalitolerans TaxID=687207 RepID=A0A852TMR5_9ACTN|nr:FAD-dependent oxidoreductase [Spinactinospora alkalitolerans]NYE45239.1 glycine/D-amino acid oxidase-like deaminating enzyme [Spinactinospora alkalitolerans]